MRDLLTVLHAQRIRAEEVFVTALAAEPVAELGAVDARELAHRGGAAHRGELLLFERDIAR